MADAILMSGGVGGVTSDDVTARREHVLQGYTALTADSDDEPVQGTMTNRGNIVDTVSFENALLDSKFLARMEEGFYLQNGQWKPCVAIPYAVLANVAGIDASRMLSNLTVAGVNGKIKMVDTQTNNYKGNLSTNYGIDTWNNHTFWMDFPHGNAYYYRADGHPHCCIPAEALGTAQADSVLSGQTATSQNGVKFSGTIPRWICTTGDVISANNGDGHAWDDIYAGRGRGIVVGIKNGHYIQGAGWVFLPSPNLYPQNVVKNVNINGVTGARDFVDKVSDHMVATNVEISMMNRNQSIALGNAYANAETVFFGVETIREDVWDGFVRRDKGNGCYLIGRIPVSKSDSNFFGTFIRNTPVQIEIARDNAGNISLIHHGPNQALGAVRLNIYIYAHSSISFRF